MKKILLLVFPLFLSLASQAQSYTTTSGSSDTVSASYVGGSPFDIHNDIASGSSTAVRLKWRVIYMNFGTGWDPTASGVCDNIECKSNISALYNNGNGAYQVTDPYTNLSTFKVQFFAGNVPVGSRAVVTVNVIDTVTGYSRNLTFIANKFATGISQQVTADNSVVIYPNPARESINVVFDKDQNVKTIAIFNLIGKTLRVFKPTDNNSAKLDLENIPSGVYFLRLMNAQGEVVATRRFTRQ